MCEIVPTKEVLVDPLCQIKGILVEKDHWIIQVLLYDVLFLHDVLLCDILITSIFRAISYYWRLILVVFWNVFRSHSPLELKLSCLVLSCLMQYQFELIRIVTLSVQDEGGALWRSDLPDFKMTNLLQFHAGPIAGLVSSPISHEMASAGSDGTVSSSRRGYFQFAPLSFILFK